MKVIIVKDKIFKSIFVGGSFIFYGYVIKKLNDIHKEIINLEKAEDVYYKIKR